MQFLTPNLMRLIYTLLFYLATPFIYLRLYIKAKKLPQYKKRIHERFMVGKIPAKEVDVWLHAVSLGEVVAAIPLVLQLIDKNLQVLITTMTPTGSEKARTYFKDKVVHQYLPYDLPHALVKFFNTYKPKLGIIMETELWPNVIHVAVKKNIPLMLANARISDKAYKQYIKMRFFFKHLLAKFEDICAQSPEDRMRFISLGANQAKVHTLGNMKFDLLPKLDYPEKFLKLKKLWGDNRPVLMLASTHDNEEEQILAHFRKLKSAIDKLVILIAPRHPERFFEVYTQCVKHGFKVYRRSVEDSIDNDADVIVLDCLGELLGFYSISDYAFVGGTLVPVGGHNVLEAVAMQVPAFSGKYVQNAKAIYQSLSDVGAMVIAPNANELVDAIITLHKHPQLRALQVEKANEVLEDNKGSVQRHLECALVILG